MSDAAEFLESVYTPEFERAAKGIFTDDDLQSLEASIMERPEAAPTIAGTGGMRKLRVPVPGRGKRGGARVIYYYRNTRGRVYLITAYLKNVADTISDEGKKVLRQLAKQLDEEG